MTRLPKRALADERCLCRQTLSLNHTVVGLKHIHLFRTLQPTKCSHTSSLSALQTVPWGRWWLRDHSTLEASQAAWPESRHSKRGLSTGIAKLPVRSAEPRTC